MRRLVQVFIGFFIVSLAIAVGIVCYWLQSDTGRLREALQIKVTAQLGRQVTIAGEMRTGFSLSQGLILKITDLRLANAPGFESAPMLTVPQLEIAVGVGTLFSNIVDIRSLVLSGAALNLAQKEDGTDNWTFRAPERFAVPTIKPDKGSVAFGADQVRVDDLLVTYSTSAGTETVQVSALKFQADVTEPFTLIASLSYRDRPYQIDFTAGPLQTLLDGIRQPIALQVQTPQHRLALRGSYSRHDALHRLDKLQVQMDGQSADGYAGWSHIAARPQVTLQLKLPVLALPRPNDNAQANASQTVQGPLFSRALLPWGWLSLLDFDAMLDIGHVQRGGEDWGPLHLNLQLAQSQFAANAIAQPPGVAQPLRLDLTANAQQQATAALTAAVLNPSLWTGFMGSPPFVQSPASLNFYFAGRGASPHDLAATAQGSLSFTAQPGKLDASAIPVPVRRALDAVLGPKALDDASLACLKAAFTAQNGILRVDGSNASGIGLDSNVLAVSGDGAIDLASETLDLRLVAAPKLPQLSQMLLPLHVTGTLADPRVDADLAATAGQAAGQLVGKLAGVLPGVRAGVMAAKAIRQDPTVTIIQPPNPCIPKAAAAAPAPVPDNATQPSRLPPELQQKLKGARDLLDQFIKAGEQPTAPPAEPAAHSLGTQ